MNKKLFLGMFAAVGMLFATSCSNDELDEVQSGNEATVSFNLGVEGGVQTRATISDGSGANWLEYAVFDKDGNRLTDIEKVERDANFAQEGGETVTLTLAKGQTYKVAFWAQNSSTDAYDLDDNMNLTIDYDDLNNEEDRDAFFKTVEITVKGNNTETVVLRRPFAQLNVGVTADDWNNAIASGIEIEKSKVLISKVASKMNLVNGTVSTPMDIEYSLGNIPTQKLSVKDENGTAKEYHYLSMSYFLVNDVTTGAAKATLEKVEFTFAPETGQGNEIKFGEGLTNVPVQRNWRTNILGQILTGTINFKIIIDAEFEGEYNGDENGNFEQTGVKAGGKYYATLAEALKAGESDIQLAVGEYEFNTNINTSEVKITGASPETKIKIISNGSAGPDKATFENLTIVSRQDNYAGMAHLGETTFNGCVIENQYTCYSGAQKTTFNNCKFVQTSSGLYNIWTYGSDVDFNNCEFYSAGKSVLVYHDTPSTPVRTATVNLANCRFFASAPATGKAAIEITSSVNDVQNLCPSTVTIENCTAEGFAEGSDSKNTLYNVKDGSEGTYSIVNLKGTNTYVDGLVKDKDGKWVASNVVGLKKAISLGATEINLTANTYNAKDFSITGKESVILRGEGDNVVLYVETGIRTFDNSKKVKLENLTVKTSGGNYKGLAGVQDEILFHNCKFDNLYFVYSQAKHTFSSCEFNAKDDEHCVWTYNNKDVAFKDCTFSYSERCVNVYTENNWIADGAYTFENCSFYTTNDGSVGAVEINSGSFTGSVTVNFDGCTEPSKGKLVFISKWSNNAGTNATVTIDGKETTPYVQPKE